MDWAHVQIETHQLANHVYYLHGSGANACASVGPDGILLVDSEFEPMSAKIKQAVIRLRPGRIEYLIDTHWHTDHTGGNADFAKDGTTVIAQDNVLARMQTPQYLPYLNLKCDPAPREAWPKITFGNSMTLSFNGEEIQLFHLGPAHTDGDAVIYFPKSNVICLGDIYINGLYPIIDLGSAGTINGYFGMIDKALSLSNDQTRVIPGHGPVATKKELQAYRDMLITIRDRIEAMRQAGKTLAEIERANPSKEFDPDWASDRVGPDGLTKMIYESLSPH